MQPSHVEVSASGIVKVGDGRGFVVEGGHHRYVITAAHCLPELPIAYPASYLEERTYRSLLGPIGGEREIWAECLFADPVGDIAVLGSPDDQELGEEADAYEALVDGAAPFSVADAPLAGSAWLCSLDGRWFPCRLKRCAGGPLWLFEARDGIVGGMSGSPVRDGDGRAIGVVSVSRGRNMEELHTEGGPNPALTRNLPGWLLREFAQPAVVCRLCGLEGGHSAPGECIQALRARADELERREGAG
jgi:hypothetical protein